MTPKFLGRMLFILFIWLFALKYYLECLKLREQSEKVTIVVAFCLLTIFAVWEVYTLVKRILKEKNLLTFFNTAWVIKFLRDKRTWLVGAVILYVIFIPLVGFYLTSFGAFCIFSLILGNQNILKIIFSGVVVMATIYGIFSFLLQLSLP